MKKIEAASDGVILGAGTLRATSPNWNPKTSKRFVVTKSGNLPEGASFFQGDAYAVTTKNASFAPTEHYRLLTSGETEIDFPNALKQIRELGVEKLLLLGGSDLNGALFRYDLVDELFLTIAPKVRLGDDIPTYAGGEALPRSEIQNFKLEEHHVVGNEVFFAIEESANS